MKINPRNLYDRIAIYRLAATILAISVARSIYVTVTEVMPWTPWRLVLWAGFIVLIVAVLRDGWTIYKGRRDIHKSIKAARTTDKV